MAGSKLPATEGRQQEKKERGIGGLTEVHIRKGSRRRTAGGNGVGAKGWRYAGTDYQLCAARMENMTEHDIS